MNIIRDKAANAQPTAAAFTVEEHTIDTRAGQGIDLTGNPDLLLNPTLTSRDVDTAPDRASGWDAFRARVATGKYQPGTGIRLVLLGGDR